MNAVIALCSFCEGHGPSVLFCTQSFHPEEQGPESQDVDADVEFDTAQTPLRDAWRTRYVPTPTTPDYDGDTPGNGVGGVPSATSTPASPAPAKSEKCDICRSFAPGQTGYISTDHDTKVSYVSSQNPQHPKVYSLVRQACLRSLSCEVGPGGPIFFGDAHQGHVLSYTFYIRDSQARGLQRQHSIIVVMMDKTYLLNSWPFLVPQISRIIHRLQDNAQQVYEADQARGPQRSQRLMTSVALTPSNFHPPRGGGARLPRSIRELTNQPDVFKHLHQSFSWILKVGGNRLSEQLFEGPPTEDSVIDMEKQEETEEGFVKLFSKKVVLDEEEDEDAEGDTEESGDEDATRIPPPTFINLRHLLRVLGFQRFHELAYHVIIGNQVIVTGARLMVRSAINCLKTLLPKGCCRAIYYSSKYEDSWKCNFLGLKPNVEVPNHVKLCVTLEMSLVAPPGGGDEDYTLPPPSGAPQGEFSSYSFKIRTTLPMPEKEPVVLRRMEFALMNEDLADSVVEQCLVCLKEEWMNKVKVLFKFTKAGGNRSEEDTRKLMQVVGALDEDRVLLKFWMTGLSVEYKSHTLSSAKQAGPI